MDRDACFRRALCTVAHGVAPSSARTEPGSPYADGGQLNLLNAVTGETSVPVDKRSLLAPVFQDQTTLVALADCCVGTLRLVSVDLESGQERPFGTILGPPVNILPLSRSHLLVLTQLHQLALVSPGETKVIARHLTAATG